MARSSRVMTAEFVAARPIFSHAPEIFSEPVGLLFSSPSLEEIQKEVPMTASHKSSHDAIRRVLYEHAAAMSAKQADKAMSFCAPEIVRYDLAPPLISSGMSMQADRA